MSPEAAEKLDVERSGGFAGLTRRASIPLAELEPREMAAVEECFHRGSTPPSGADRFVYRFRMHGRETVVQEDRMPEELQRLLDRLDDAWS